MGDIRRLKDEVSELRHFQEKCEKYEEAVSKYKLKIEELNEHKMGSSELVLKNQQLQTQLDYLKNESRKSGSLIDKKDDIEFQILKEKFEQLNLLMAQKDQALKENEEIIRILEAKVSDMSHKESQPNIAIDERTMQDLIEQNNNLHKAIKKAKEVCFLLS